MSEDIILCLQKYFLYTPVMFHEGIMPSQLGFTDSTSCNKIFKVKVKKKKKKEKKTLWSKQNDSVPSRQIFKTLTSTKCYQTDFDREPLFL